VRSLVRYVFIGLIGQENFSMQRRDLIKTISAAGVASGMALPLAAWAQQASSQISLPHPSQSYKEGADYMALDKRVPTDSQGGKVEVIEFFWYSCPHCNSFEPALEAWSRRQPKEVTLRRVPVAFRDSFVPQQRLFYTLEALGKLDELHKKVFYAIHVDKQPLASQAAIVDWAVKQGLDKAKFEQTYASFAVEGKVRRASQLQDEYKVGGVPALGVGGRFYTDGSLAQNMNRALQITDWLIAEVRKGR
jgi:protein dithiol oxidoreductase (disulfide-forming)